MDKNKALQKLLNRTATEEEVELLKQALVSGEISIGGDVNRAVVIIGSGNKVGLTAEALGILKPESKSEEQVEGEPPYMGMRYFDTSDAELFYGREALTRELMARLAKENFLAIVGASGSGKSSVARAGLVPAWNAGIVESGKRLAGAVYILTPTTHPLENLAASLTRESESVTATSILMDDLKKDSRSLRLYIRKLLSQSGGTNLLLLVDQFEETFTLCKDADERKVFIENLLEAASEDDGAALVVLTLRADFYHHCFEYEGLRLALEKHQANIGAMTADELREAITAPAQAAGWDFQPGLVDLILRDVGAEPGALPLLSHALLETWKRRQGRTLTLQGYADAGGVKKAIAQTAENVYDLFSPAEQIIARGIFLRLTELGEGVQDTRRRANLDELAQATVTQDALTKVLKTLVDARLVTTEQDSAEVAHEALIREWGTLRKWLDEDRESLRLHRHLTESAHEWQNRKRETGELYRGARLKQIQDWMKEHSDGLSPLEREFLKASQNVKKRERLNWIAIAGVGMVLLLTIVLAMTGNLNSVIYRPVDMQNYWVTIPAGEFLMGSSDKEIANAKALCSDCDFSSEQPQNLITLDEFQIGKYEVTNHQYAQCVQAGICVLPANKTYTAQGYELHPVKDVSWYDAVAYCEWVGGRLPTEAEWEKAASWDQETKTKFVYPWGNSEPTSTLLNYNNEVNDTTPVGTYPAGISPYGLYDMAGNVWEWTADWYDIYPGGDRSTFTDFETDKVLRGGSWYVNHLYVRSAVRYWVISTYADSSVGFRCTRSP